MPTLTVYGDTADGYITSGNASYAMARSGGSLSSNTTAQGINVGQRLSGDYDCWEGFLSFDTSAIPDDATITSATLHLYGFFDASTTDFTIEARLYDWGATLTTADWIAGASLGTQTLLASFATSGFSLAGYNTFTSDAAFVSNVSKTGSTRLILCSSRHRGNNTPTGNEYVQVYSADEAGTTKDPKLVIEYTLAANVTVAHLQKITSAADTAHTSLTSTSSAGYQGRVATFKGLVTAAAKQILVAHDDTAQYVIYRADRDSPGGSWTSTDTVVVSSTSQPVAFATGLANILYANQNFSTIRRWDNSAAAAIAGSPAGRALAFHKNRFFSGGTTANPARLWWSDLGSYATWGASSYSDDFDSDDGYPIVDLASFEDGLLVAKTNSLWFLSGSGPDDFAAQKLNAGAGYPGRCIIVTPYGAVIAGRRTVWLWTGGSAEEISNPIEQSYALSGDFVSGAYADGICYICDESQGTIFCVDLERGTWWIEKIDSPTTQGPAVLGQTDSVLYYGPQAGTVTSLAAYKEVPGATRSKDFSTMTETFNVRTPELMPAGPDRRFTPLRLYIRWRQRGGTTGQAGVSATPYYDGAAGTTRTLTVESTTGVKRSILEMSSDAAGKGIKYCQFRFTQTVGASDASLIDIEEIVLEYQVSQRG